ncbi:hypothetical protein SEA_OGOPOGO_58 [Mycobacterium phage Ogopogo]|nr:hypothetical protein SEA_OGOPOGO_58 [Mycobacterium phage Ogopogo]
MNLVERLNARFNNVIHDGLAEVGYLLERVFVPLNRKAMSNALGRDIGLDYGDVLVAAEAEVEVHEPRSSAERRVSADQSPVSVGDIGPGAGMVPPPPAPGPSNPLNTYVAGPLGEAIPGDEFMELGEFLDTATLEELAAIRQHTEVSRADLELHLRWYTTARVSPEVVAQSLLDSYRITPR